MRDFLIFAVFALRFNLDADHNKDTDWPYQQDRLDRFGTQDSVSVQNRVRKDRDLVTLMANRDPIS